MRFRENERNSTKPAKIIRRIIPCPLRVGMGKGVAVLVAVGVFDGVGVMVGMGGFVGVLVGVLVGVCVGVLVGVNVGAAHCHVSQFPD